MNLVSKIILLGTTMVKFLKTRYSVYSKAIATKRKMMEPQDHKACMGVIYRKFLWYERF